MSSYGLGALIYPVVLVLAGVALGRAGRGRAFALVWGVSLVLLALTLIDMIVVPDPAAAPQPGETVAPAVLVLGGLYAAALVASLALYLLLSRRARTQTPPPK